MLERILDPLQRFGGLRDRGFSHDASSVIGELRLWQGGKARAL
jgi:hypothetical protein